MTKPKILQDIEGIPKKISELTNDSNFITENKLNTSLGEMENKKADKVSLDTKVNTTDYSKLNVYVSTITGASTAYVGSISNGQNAYADGQMFTIIPNVDCGNNPTFNFNNIGALTIVKQDGSAVSTGDIKANKPLSLVRVGSNFFIRSGGAPISTINMARSGQKNPSLNVATSGDMTWSSSQNNIYLNVGRIDHYDWAFVIQTPIPKDFVRVYMTFYYTFFSDSFMIGLYASNSPSNITVNNAIVTFSNMVPGQVTTQFIDYNLYNNVTGTSYFGGKPTKTPSGGLLTFNDLLFFR